MSAVLMSFKSHIEGKNADVEIYSDRIEWARQRGSVSGGKLLGAVATGGVSLLATGVSKKGQRGSETIPVKAMTSVNTKRDGLVNTLVQVTVSGNTLGFRVGHDLAQQIKVLLTQLMLGNHFSQQAPPTVTSPTVPTPASAPTVDIAEQLGKFAALRDQGVLSEDEFQVQKAKLLS